MSLTLRTPVLWKMLSRKEDEGQEQKINLKREEVGGRGKEEEKKKERERELQKKKWREHDLR
jgi:hypothetical protein